MSALIRIVVSLARIWTPVACARLVTWQVFLALALLSSSGLSHAKLVTWHLQDARFEDGSRLTGSFVLDTAAGCEPARPVCHYQFPSFDLRVSGHYGLTQRFYGFLDPHYQPGTDVRANSDPAVTWISFDTAHELVGTENQHGFAEDMLRLDFDEPLLTATTPVRLSKSSIELYRTYIASPTGPSVVAFKYQTIVDGTVTTAIPEPGRSLFVGSALILAMVVAAKSRA